MYSKISTLTIVGLLAAGVMGQSSSPVTTPTTTVTASSTVSTSSGASSSSTVPASSTTITSSPTSTITSSSTTVDPSSLVTTKSNIHTASVWSYFNVTVTSVVVVQELTTLCKAATTLTFNGCEYPATKGQVVVVTNCPCTVTTTVPTISSSLCPPGVTQPAIALPPPVEIAPAPKITPTAIIPVPVPSSKPTPATPSYIQVGSASSSGHGHLKGLMIAAAAVVLGF
ncbi:hypothetical protein E0Z10_g2963 [Xylaria hypoxylon]|uniref:Uncharacterized protein n=1 Tax=Xylaria hypoxylon TaxID=37992 RepID=A0A4Z0YPU3_9PEZI|nr:hypothetical protein E0Z10_g2963 [Xylaria hypoxylon]